jgi:hypothetical protein
VNKKSLDIPKYDKCQVVPEKKIVEEQKR